MPGPLGQLASAGKKTDNLLHLQSFISSSKYTATHTEDINHKWFCVNNWNLLNLQIHS